MRPHLGMNKHPMAPIFTILRQGWTGSPNLQFDNSPKLISRIGEVFFFEGGAEPAPEPEQEPEPEPELEPYTNNQ